MESPVKATNVLLATQGGYKKDSTTIATVALATNLFHLIETSISLRFGRDPFRSENLIQKDKQTGAIEKKISQFIVSTVLTPDSADCTQ